MQSEDRPFSQRQGFAPNDPEITIRTEAPPSLRFALSALARRGGLSNNDLLELLTHVFLVAPEGNWSPKYIEDEVNRLLQDASWESVYDCAEAIYLRLKRLHETEYTDPAAHEWFERELNIFFHRNGIGWQMTTGHIEFRGPEPLEAELASAIDELKKTARPTAERELTEARRDLSRRPDPDVTGAIQHAIASLECLSRDVSSDEKVTFGDLIKRNPDLFPKPLDVAMSKVWGYASEFARHIREGRVPSLSEAILVVGLAASVAAFLIERERTP